MVGAEELGFRATSLPTLVQMVAGGAGVTLLPRLALPVELSRADLCIRSFAAPGPSRTIVIAWRRRSFLADALRRIAAAIQSGYAEAVTRVGRSASAAAPPPPGRAPRLPSPGARRRRT